MEAAGIDQGGLMPDRIIQINNVPYLFFSGTAYLCMNHNAAFTRLVEEGMQLYGTNYGSSRSGNFQLPVYEKAELQMAANFQAEAALTVSSGYMAAQLVIRHFENDAVFSYAPDCHPALLRSKNDYYTGPFQDWITGLSSFLETHASSQVVLVCNSVDPLRVQLFDFSWMATLPSHPNLTLVVDDSHGVGINGEKRAGIYSTISSYSQINTVVVSSLGKALGLPGGMILGSRDMIKLFRKSPYFTAASPMAPAYLHAYLQGVELYASERNQLAKTIELFSSHLPSNAAIHLAANYPVAYCKNNEMAEFLYERKILISSFSYPTPEDERITRIILNSHHTEPDIEKLLSAIQEFVTATG